MRKVQPNNIIDLLNRPLGDIKGTIKSVNDISLALNLDASQVSQEVSDYIQGITPSSNDGHYNLSDIKDIDDVSTLVDAFETRFVQDRSDKLRYASALQENLNARLQQIKSDEERAALQAKYDELFK